MAAMPSERTRSLSRPLANPRFRTLLWVLLGFGGWGGLVAIGVRLVASTPPRAGFDLELLLEAGRRVAAGQSPYAPIPIVGGAVQAESLFYSYPPPVAQTMSFFAGVPSWAMLLVWGLAATLGMVLVIRLLERRVRSGASIVLPLVALVPYVFPFAVAVLFGNLDAWFPVLYGLILLGALRGGRRGWAGAGIVLALVTLSKLHPVSLGAWFLVRGWRDRRDGRRAGPWLTGPWLTLAVSVVVGLALVIVSVVGWGIGPWRDYLAVVRAASGAALIDPRNIGPASQLAGILGLGEQAARLLQVPVTLGAFGLTAWAAWTRRDPVESLAWATVASLVTLPVTWFHYPVALIPFAAVALAQADRAVSPTRVRVLLAAAVVVAALTIAAPVLLWVAVALVLAAVRAAARASGRLFPLTDVG